MTNRGEFSQIDNLPHQYRFAHEFSFALHDQMAQMIVEGEQRDLFSIRIPRKKVKSLPTSNLEGEDIWTWLEKNGFVEELRQLVFRQVFAALLSDLCHFVYEGLVCSRKGKLSVAYSLLRKPFKDNLFYLEWLLADRV